MSVSTSSRPDAIIVGAGIVGAACAYYLSLGGIRSLVLEFGMALFSILLYYALTGFGEKLGRNNWAPPFVAVWLTNLLFIALLALRFRALERVPRA